MTSESERAHEDLFEAAKTRDPAAVDALLERHLPALRAFIRLHAGAVIRAKESCSDLVQSVCREVLADMPHFEYRGEPQFRAWVQKQAMHKIVNRNEYYRAQKRDARRELGQPSRESRADAHLLAAYESLGSPSFALAQQEAIARLESAFDEIPEQYREAILLRRITGLSYDEIATQLGKSEGAVRNLVHRGLARLTLILRDRLGDS